MLGFQLTGWLSQPFFDHEIVDAKLELEGWGQLISRREDDLIDALRRAFEGNASLLVDLTGRGPEFELGQIAAEGIVEGPAENVHEGLDVRGQLFDLRAERRRRGAGA